MNGAPGSAWASLVSDPGTDAEEVVVLGAPANDDPAPLTADHLFDLASLTKIFTTVAALRLVDDGMLDLDAPVVGALRVGTGAGRERITLRHLLTHSSGLVAEGGAWRGGLTGEELRAAVLRSELRAEPGGAHLYSDVGLIAVGELLERVSGRSLTDLVADAAARMGAATLTWAPSPESAVATEMQRHRGPVRGEVHDELAHALGRPAGHAGLFGTVHDVAALARMVRDEGVGESGRVISVESAHLLITPVMTADDGYGQALGLRVRDKSWMGGADAAGHTGFTGTAFAVGRASGAYAVLLTNRVHPTREDADANPARREFFRVLG
ncbi:MULTISPECIES: serine hydrolase [unclassified Microbacterium]|uniref:serine hydrolase domain-containing protein n=1 Tax=unclassified Microbacterium TaxID=2609290 RepID=UPI00217E0395|nr:MULTISPECIES: serine hydrolase domain-containing protein [unclassified Microbacterium]